ncbi:MAG: hypothetical protein HC905_12585 [Bacteroidales bacterium]|nr:hypothetical protein [Bacteroidales bacterium]
MKADNKLLYFGIFPVVVILIIFFFVFVKVNSAEDEMIEYILPMTFQGHFTDKITDEKIMQQNL